MRTTEADSIDELIADCAHIPSSVRASSPGVLPPRPASAWEVTDDCRALLRNLEEYV